MAINTQQWQKTFMADFEDSTWDNLMSGQKT
jgi:hypothetical protein